MICIVNKKLFLCKLFIHFEFKFVIEVNDSKNRTFYSNKMSIPSMYYNMLLYIIIDLNLYD